METGRESYLGNKVKGKCSQCAKPLGHSGAWGLCISHYRSARAYELKTALVNAMGGCCMRCGGVFALCVYDFHHNGDKDHAPTVVISDGSLAKIAKEMAKCEVLCANCHRVEHEL